MPSLALSAKLDICFSYRVVFTPESVKDSLLTAVLSYSQLSYISGMSSSKSTDRSWGRRRALAENNIGFLDEKSNSYLGPYAREN